MIPTEAECRAAVLNAARLGGWRIHCPRKVQTNKGKHLTADEGHRGWPDLTLCRAGQLVCIELKRDKTGRMGEGQQEWIDVLDAVPGVIALTVFVPSQMQSLIERLIAR